MVLRLGFAIEYLTGSYFTSPGEKTIFFIEYKHFANSCFNTARNITKHGESTTVLYNNSAGTMHRLFACGQKDAVNKELRKSSGNINSKNRITYSSNRNHKSASKEHSKATFVLLIVQMGKLSQIHTGLFHCMQRIIPL